MFNAYVCVFLRHQLKKYRFKSLALISLSQSSFHHPPQMIRMSKISIFIIAMIIFFSNHSVIDILLHIYENVIPCIYRQLFNLLSDTESLWSVAEPYTNKSDVLYICWLILSCCSVGTSNRMTTRMRSHLFAIHHRFFFILRLYASFICSPHPNNTRCWNFT